MADDSRSPDATRADNPFSDLVGFRITQAGDGFARAELEVLPTLYNPHGVLHGGVVCAMADNSMGAAVYTCLAPEERCSTIEVKVNFIKPVQQGRLVCETQVVDRGDSTAVLRSSVTLAGELVATAQGTYAIRRLP